MANRWQMAKAFGRAVFGKSDKENPAAKMARDVYGRDLRNYVDKDAAGRAEAFNRGNEEAWMDNRSIVRGKDGRPDVKLESEDVVEARGDARLDDNLQQDFDEGFEASFNRAKGTFNEAMDKLGGYTPEDKEQAYDRLRQLMIDKLKNGEPIQDVLDWGKNKYILIK